MSRWPRASAWDHHRPCPGGCGQLDDECACSRPRILGNMRVSNPWTAGWPDHLYPEFGLRNPRTGEVTTTWHLTEAAARQYARELGTSDYEVVVRQSSHLT